MIRACQHCGRDYDPRFAGAAGWCDQCRSWVGEYLARQRRDSPARPIAISHDAPTGGDDQ